MESFKIHREYVGEIERAEHTKTIFEILYGLYTYNVLIEDFYTSP